MKVNINDKDYGLQWGLGCLEIYCDRMDCDISGLDLAFIPNKEREKAMVMLIYAAMQNYAELHEIDFTLTIRQLQAWIDEAPQEICNAIWDDFKMSKYFGKTIAEHFGIAPAGGEVKKKRQPSRKSSS